MPVLTVELVAGLKRTQISVFRRSWSLVAIKHTRVQKVPTLAEPWRVSLSATKNYAGSLPPLPWASWWRVRRMPEPETPSPKHFDAP